MCVQRVSMYWHPELFFEHRFYLWVYVFVLSVVMVYGVYVDENTLNSLLVLLCLCCSFY